MQDIDFSQSTRRHSLPLGAEASTVSRDTDAKKKPGPSGLFFTPLLVTALLTFSLGLIAGVFLAKAKNIEGNIISRPDETHFHGKDPRNGLETIPSPRAPESPQNRIKPSSFTNVSSPELGEAPFLIKLGVYPASKAQEVVRRLNLSTELLQQKGKAHRCKNIKRRAPFSLKQFSFAVPVPGMPQKENVLLGCFMNKNSAMTFLAKLINTSIPETQNAQLFQIAE